MRFNQYITQNLNIEPYLKTKNLSGTVTISFSINKLGAVTDVRIINSLDSVGRSQRAKPICTYAQLVTSPPPTGKTY